MYIYTVKVVNTLKPPRALNEFIRLRQNPPTSLSVERVRRRHQPASPPATNLTPPNSLRSSAIQPASTPNLVAASTQARWLA